MIMVQMHNNTNMVRITPIPLHLTFDCRLVQHVFPYNTASFISPLYASYDGLLLIRCVIRSGNICIVPLRIITLPLITKYGEIADFELSTPVK